MAGRESRSRLETFERLMCMFVIGLDVDGIIVMNTFDLAERLRVLNRINLRRLGLAREEAQDDEEIMRRLDGGGSDERLSLAA